MKLLRLAAGMDNESRAKVLGFLHLAGAPDSIAADLVIDASGSVTLKMQAIDQP